MSAPIQRSGACACGAVTFTATAPADYGVCHCHTCRRWVGGPFLAVNCGANAAYSGEMAIWNSSDWAERACCAVCGGALFYRLKATGEHYIAVGTFDDQDGWRMAGEIFHDLKPAHYAFANATQTMTEAETLALFAAGGAPD